MRVVPRAYTCETGSPGYQMKANAINMCEFSAGISFNSPTGVLFKLAYVLNYTIGAVREC